MRREKFISGGLEGAGVEGKNKRQLSSKERRENEDKDLMDTGFGHTGKPPLKKSSGSKIGSGDPFYTGFGESRPEKKGHYSERSNKEKGSDIFSDGFGSKEISGGRSAAGSRRAGNFDEGNAGERNDFSEDAHIAAPAESKKKRRSPEDDPFYTGFGYTNQREDDNIRHSENEPLKRENLTESPEKITRNEVKEEINFAEGDDIFVNMKPEKEVTEDLNRECISEDIKEPVRGGVVESFSVSDRDDDQIDKREKTVKKSSIFERDDDDLFSV